MKLTFKYDSDRPEEMTLDVNMRSGYPVENFHELAEASVHMLGQIAKVAAALHPHMEPKKFINIILESTNRAVFNTTGDYMAGAVVSDGDVI
mgnify:CR=1 FL=1